MLIRLLIVIACFFIIFASFRRAANDRDWIFLLTGMFFTVLAETLWLFNTTLAVAMYCAVPAAYALRVAKKSYALVLIATIICALPLGFWVRGNALSAFAILYICLYISTIVASVRNLWINVNSVPFSNRMLTLIGVLLFLVCDICMVVSYTVHGSLSYISCYATWVLFPSAQLSLAFSALNTSGTGKDTIGHLLKPSFRA